LERFIKDKKKYIWMIIKVNPLKRYSSLILGIGKILEEGRKNVAKTVNNIMLQTYWEIGREIIQFEQGGRERADYGSELLAALSRDHAHDMAKDSARATYTSCGAYINTIQNSRQCLEN
jgi:hypothetical protein